MVTPFSRAEPGIRLEQAHADLAGVTATFKADTRATIAMALALRCGRCGTRSSATPAGHSSSCSARSGWCC